MKPNPPIRGHKLLAEGHVRYRYDEYESMVPTYGCECGERAETWQSVGFTKRWHRKHKAALRTLWGAKA